MKLTYDEQLSSFALDFNLRRYTEGALKGGLASVARGDSREAAAARMALLVRAGAFTADGGEGAKGGGGAGQRMLQFELRLGTSPRVLAGIAGLMCCTPDEALAMADAVLGGAVQVDPIKPML